MYSTIISGAVYGINSYLVSVEVDIANGLPGIDMVGSLSSEVKEAKERVRVALNNSGFALPASHITINLSPANVRKASPPRTTKHRCEQRKSPDSNVGDKSHKKQNENQPSFEVRFSLSMVGHQGLEPGTNRL